MAKQMTVAYARELLERAGVTIRNTGFGEYRVNLKHGDEETAYYANDLRDAVNTGLDMAKRNN